jgi:hypothetical protein
MLIGGFVVALLMTADASLANSTHWRTGGLCAAYMLALTVLYGGWASTVACRPVYAMWENLGNRPGRDFIDFLWQLSGFTGFTISTSGTKSNLWRNFGYVLFAIFVIALVVSILPR